MDIKKALSFLSKLKKNNNREWFEKNKPEFLSIKDEFEEFITKIIKEVGKFDPSIRSLEAKNSIFRIYKDVRFSKDKTPYKTHIGAYIAPGGRKSVYGGYYIHIEPGNSFIAGGIWMPESPVLNSIRQEIDYNTNEFLKIIKNKSFKKYFGGVEGDKLARNPKDYPADHPHIDLLKFKSYNMIHAVNDKKITSPDFLKYAATVFKAMKPFNDFLNRAVE